MKFKNLTFVFLMLFSLILITGCSDDKSPTEPADTTKPQAPEIKPIEIPAKMAQSQDPMAQMAMQYIYFANGFSGYSSFFTPPTGNALGKATGDSLIYTWDIDSMTITLVIKETEEMYFWKVIINGFDGHNYIDHWTFINVEEKIDGTYGLMTLFNEFTTDKMTEWMWEIDENGIYSFTLTNYAENNQPFEKIEISVSPDGSGELKHYEYVGTPLYAQLTFKVEWTASGSGQWWTYVNGIETNSGRWG